MSKLFNSISLGIPMIWGSHPLKESENAKPQGIPGGQVIKNAASSDLTTAPPARHEPRTLASCEACSRVQEVQPGKRSWRSQWHTVTICNDHRSEKNRGFLCQLQWAHWKITLQNSSPKILSDFWFPRNHPPNHHHHRPTYGNPRFRSHGTFRTERMPIATTTKSKMFQPQRRGQCGVASWKGREGSRMLCVHIRIKTL